MADEPKTKGQRTQEKIVSEALRLFGKHGFSQTSMQMIATACELSQGAVMQHFPSKARLLEAVRRTVTASNHGFIDSRIDLTDDAITVLRKHLSLTIEWAVRFPEQASIIVLTYAEAFHDTANREVAGGALRLGRERILRYVLAAQREGAISKKLDAELLAESCQYYLIGLVISTAANGTTVRHLRAYEEKIENFVDQFTK